MVIFHSYVSHYQRVNPIKPPFSYGFPMVFPMEHGHRVPSSTVNSIIPQDEALLEPPRALQGEALASRGELLRGVVVGPSQGPGASRVTLRKTLT